MAISNYTELQTAVGNWINRTNLTARIPEFISLAEAKLNRNLRLYRMESIATGTLSSGTDTISFPADYAAISKVQINGSTTFILDQMSKEHLIRKYGSPTSGLPAAFAINNNEIEVKPIADGDYTYELSYYKKFDIATDTTNWLLSLYPDVYLYGSVLEAAPYMKDKDSIAVWSALYGKAIDELKRMDNRDKYSGGTLTMRAG